MAGNRVGVSPTLKVNTRPVSRPGEIIYRPIEGVFWADILDKPTYFPTRLQDIAQSGATSGQVPVWSGTSWVASSTPASSPIGVAGGDLSGSYPSPSVVWGNGVSFYDTLYPKFSGSYADPSWITSLAWSKISGRPTTLAGYGITDPIVLTSGSYADPSWIISLAWSKITGRPTTLSGYGITDPIVLTTGSYNNPSWITGLAWGKISGVPNFWLQGGNAFGAAGVIGLNDNNPLSFVTNGIARLNILADGAAAFGGTASTNIALTIHGVNQANTSFALAINNSNNRMFSFRNDGEYIMGPAGFGPSIRPLNSTGGVSPAAGVVMNFRKRDATAASVHSFIFDTIAETAVNLPGQGFMRISPSWTNGSHNHDYNILNISGSVNQFSSNIVRGLFINTTVSGGDYRAIETASGRHIFNGSQDWALRVITANRTLDTSDMIVLANANSSSIDITLPSVTASNRIYIIRRTDTSANTVNIVGTVNGSSGYVLFGGMSVWLVWDNANSTWRTF